MCQLLFWGWSAIIIKLAVVLVQMSNESTQTVKDLLDILPWQGLPLQSWQLHVTPCQFNPSHSFHMEMEWPWKKCGTFSQLVRHGRLLTDRFHALRVIMCSSTMCTGVVDLRMKSCCMLSGTVPIESNLIGVVIFANIWRWRKHIESKNRQDSIHSIGVRASHQGRGKEYVLLWDQPRWTWKTNWSGWFNVNLHPRVPSPIQLHQIYLSLSLSGLGYKIQTV